MMIVVYFFGEVGFAILGPCFGEVWPSKLRTTGTVFSYGIGGRCKIFGPLGLGLMLSSSKGVKPEVSEGGPGFLCFGFWYLLVVVLFMFVGFETRRKSIEQHVNEIEEQRRLSLV